MSKPLFVLFPGGEQVSLAEVGGKAASLIRMTEAGLQVPPGAVLTTRFFQPWLDSVKASMPWIRLTEATPEEWPPLCDLIKEQARSLRATATQHEVLATLRRDFATPGAAVRFAVRSSSPEEDQALASFAGGYETLLGVPPNDLEDEEMRALVACEYGKPCVVGIDRIAATLRDGQTVEVDGNTGTVRLLE